jgi:carboxymethylenebutenolidase
VYPDTPHGFFCPERDTYRPGPAADAWVRTRRLLAGKCA